MINRAEISKFAEHFFVPDEQIVRDHLISHVIAALPQLGSSITFFGGTALCRTWLPGLRLSEDIDLLVDTTEIGIDLTKVLSFQLRREFPEHAWMNLGSEHEVATWNLRNANSVVKVQFVQWRDRWQSIPTTTRGVQLRYSDLLDNVELAVPTPRGFVVMKLLAWFDRQTPRDLFDLAALADAGMFDAAAIRLVKSIAGFTPSSTNLDRVVPQTVTRTWQTELGNQLADISTADKCLSTVRDALDRLGPATDVNELSI